MNTNHWLHIIGLVTLLSAGWRVEAQELQTSLDQQTNVAVTIYNNNLALIKDSRRIRLQEGLNNLAFKDVSAQIRPETAALRSLTHAQGFFLLEQNFDFDLLTPQKLLEKYVGKTVSIIKRHPTTGEETSVKATVLAANNGVVLRIGDQIETGIPGRIAYGEVPANLRDRPTLVMQLNSGTSQPQNVELSYLTGGLSWQADYVAEISQADNQLDLLGWVTLTNQSGTRYQDATLQLVAGDVNRVQSNQMKAEGMVMEMARSRPVLADQMSEQGLFEYHLYTLGRKTTLAENQTKQVSLLTAQSVPVTKELLLMGNDYYYMSSYGDIGQKMKVGVYIKIKNDKKSNLGMPLPKGVVRVYKKDHSGNAQFIGEDRIDHTPKNEEISLKLGDAFDVTADKKQTDFKKVKGDRPYNYVYTATFEVELKNAKDSMQIVKVREPIPGDWKMLNSNFKFQKTAAHTAEWDIPVPAEGKATLKYQVRVRF